ncbi:hypothetical protein N9W76_00690 [Planktomarina temperata]|nr:hypothetical protein [Planktomarina temperata]
MKKLKLHKISYFWVIILLSLNTFPLMPGNTIRPIFLLFLPLYYIKYVPLNFRSVIFLLLLISFLFSSALFISTKICDVDALVDIIFKPLGLFISLTAAAVGYSMGFRASSSDFRQMMLASRLILIAGVLQIVSSFLNIGVMSEAVHFFTELFSESTAGISRVRLLTLEPSWAGIQIICLHLPVFVFYYMSLNQKFSIFRLSLPSTMLLGTASGTTAILLFFAFIRKASTEILTLRVWFFGGCIALLGLYISQQEFFQYAIGRLSFLLTLNLYGDFSVGTRFVGFLAGVEVFSRYPVFGVGPYCISSALSQTAFEMEIPEALKNFFQSPGITPKNFFVRVLSEYGLLGLLILLIVTFGYFQAIKCKASSVVHSYGEDFTLDKTVLSSLMFVQVMCLLFIDSPFSLEIFYGIALTLGFYSRYKLVKHNN